MPTGISQSNTSNLQSTQKILINAAVLANEPAAPDPSLIWSIRLPKGHYQWNVATWARLSAATALTQGVDLSQTQQLVTNVTTINPTEHGIIATPSKMLITRQGDADVMATIGELLGISLRIREALDVIALYDTFTKSVGATGRTLDVAYFRGSVAYLMTDNSANYGPAAPPFNSSLHIEHISDVIMDLTSGHDIGTTEVHAIPQGIPQELLQSWWKARDRLYGVQLYHGGNITRDASNDSKGALFNMKAMAIVHQLEADATEQPDASARLVEVGLFQLWGEALRADPHGVEMFFNSAATV